MMQFADINSEWSAITGELMTNDSVSPEHGVRNAVPF